jgi:hypothetical protein
LGPGNTQLVLTTKIIKAEANATKIPKCVCSPERKLKTRSVVATRIHSLIGKMALSNEMHIARTKHGFEL